MKKLLILLIFYSCSLCVNSIVYADNIGLLLNETGTTIAEAKNRIYINKYVNKYLDKSQYYYFDAEFLFNHTNLCSYNPIAKSIADESELKDPYEYINGECLLKMDMDLRIISKINRAKEYLRKAIKASNIIYNTCNQYKILLNQEKANIDKHKSVEDKVEIYEVLENVYKKAEDYLEDCHILEAGLIIYSLDHILKLLDTKFN
jgi:hypothetical protein